MYGGGLDAQAILENKAVIVLYFAVLLILIIMIVWNLKTISSASSEHAYFGYGLPNSIQYAAGAPDVRFQELTMTNQGSTPTNMAEIKQLYPGVVNPRNERLMNKRKRERLTSMRESPVFYDISQTLAEYQYATQFNCADGSSPLPVTDSYGNMTYACADGSSPSSASGYTCSDGSSATSTTNSDGSTSYMCANGSMPTWGGSYSGATGVDTGSGYGSDITSAEHATGAPGAAVQEALLQRQLGY